MADSTILGLVKMALRVTTDEYDNIELSNLIDAAEQDLGIAGVVYDSADAVINQAIVTYCKMRFGSPSDTEYKNLKASYDEQKAQLGTATGYTVWGDVDE